MASIPWNDQFYIGRGVNSLSQQTHDVAIDFEDPPPHQAGQKTQFLLQQVTSTRELVETLNINASASLNIGLFGLSAEFDMVKSTEVNSFYTYALVRVLIFNPPEVIRNPRLTADAERLLVQRGWDDFTALYGQEYITGKVSGGVFYGLIEIQTSSAIEQQEIKAELNASYGPFSVDGRMTASLQQKATRHGLNISIYRAGSINQIARGLDEMLEEVRNFPATVANAPVEITALVNDYRSSVPLPAIPPDNSLLVLQQRLTLEDLGRKFLEFRDYRASLDFILGRPLTDFDEFYGLDAAELNQKRAEFETSRAETAVELNRITDQATLCYKDITQCKTYVPAVRPLPLPRIGGELMNLKQMEETLRTVQMQLNDLKAGIENGAIVADKARMLQALDANHFLRFGYHDRGHDIFRIWRSYDNTWHDTLSVAHARSSDLLIQAGEAGSEASPDSAQLRQGTGGRFARTRIDFAERFAAPPLVFVAIHTLDATNQRNLRFDVWPEAATETSFNMVFSVWGDTIIYWVKVFWIAIGSR